MINIIEITVPTLGKVTINTQQLSDELEIIIIDEMWKEFIDTYDNIDIWHPPVTHYSVLEQIKEIFRDKYVNNESRIDYFINTPGYSIDETMLEYAWGNDEITDVAVDALNNELTEMKIQEYRKEIIKECLRYGYFDKKQKTFHWND